MPYPFEATTEEIIRLTDHQLTGLLSHLLYLEVSAAGIPASNVSVAMQINVPDGGEDGLVAWDGEPSHTNWIPNRITLFQSKATNMRSEDCKREICIKRSTRLKPRVEAVLDKGGSYILFYGRNCNPNQQTPRLNKFREAIARAGKGYADGADVRVYDANKIAAWTNQFISAVVAVKRWTGHTLPSSVLTWEEWQKYNEHRFEFFSDETLRRHIARLRNYFTEPRKVARITGLSGLGKTRLALETFRPPKNLQVDPQQQMLSSQAVYLDAGSTDENLPALVAEWRTQKMRGILIVDDCAPGLHRKLSREIEHADSQLSLLTLDYNPEKSQGSHLRVELQPVSNQVIWQMLTQTYKNLHESDINRIMLLTEGFPQMAVLFADARLNEIGGFGSLDDDTLVSRLLWGREERNEEAYRVISSCAVFQHVGFKDDFVEQRDIVADKIARVDRDRFYEHTQNFIERGILEVRGRFVIVKPQPLAIRLASDWWKRCPPERAVELLVEDLPKGMTAAMYGRFAKLDPLPEAREIVKRLCSVSGYFSKVEVLNSEKGAHLFASVVEVDHKHTAAVLSRIFNSDMGGRLLEIEKVPSHLIKAIEKLSLWADTFAIAAHLLLAFATRENKRTSHVTFTDGKATFTRLFQAFLAGTQASLADRLQVLKEALDNPSIHQKTIVIEALGHALETDNFGRPSGITVQGSRASLEDYSPKTWGEVFDYWRAILELLLQFACGADEDTLAVLARQQLAKRVIGLVSNRLMNDVSEAIRAVVEKNGHFWEARQPMQSAVGMFGDQLTEDERKTLQELVGLLEPHSMRDRLRLYVSEASYNDVQEEPGGEAVDQSEQSAIVLAEEFARDPNLWAEDLLYLLLGKQNYGYEFGYRMGEVIERPLIFVEVMAGVLSLLPPQQTNTILFRGFLSALQTKDPQLVRQTLDRFASDEKLRPHAMSLMLGVELQEEDLWRALKLVKEGHEYVLNLRNFAFAQRLANLPPEQIIDFSDALLEYGHEGAWAALDILYMQVVSQPERWDVYKHKLREVVMVRGILSDPRSTSQMRTHNWTQTVEKLLINGENMTTGDADLARHIATEIAEASSTGINSYSLRDEVKSMLDVLLREYRDVTWPILGDALLSEDEKGDSALPEALGYGRYRYFDSLSEAGDEDRRDPLFSPSFDDLLDWCEQHPKRGPRSLWRMMPLWATRSDRLNWHPFTLAMFDRYGDREDFLTLVEERIGFFSWSGSAAPLYHQRIQALEQLLVHPFSTVRAWAGRQIGLIREELEQQALYEEERLIRYY